MKSRWLQVILMLGVFAVLPPLHAQDIGGWLKRTAKQVQDDIAHKGENKVREAVARPLGTAPDGNGGNRASDARQKGEAITAAVADDSAAARDAAITRLRATAPRSACADAAAMSRTYGTTCNSREFPAPPILSAPAFAWQTKPGWWGAWSPFLVGNLMLTGSCNNDDNAGLSALDMKTGKTVWRIGDICKVGNRRGSTGNVAFHELSSGEVLLIYPRENGEPTDFYVIDVKAGHIVHSLKPVANLTLRGHGGSFVGLNQSNQDGFSSVIGLSPALDKMLWRNGGFRLAMRNDDPRYMPTFSPSAMVDGILFMTARSKDQAEPPTRQLHAIDLRTGQTLWRHRDQPVAERSNTSAWRSDDGTPMVAGGKVVIRVQGLLGAAGIGRKPDGDALRALDPRSGNVAWTTKAVPGQRIGNYIAAGDMLIVETERGGTREVWGYRLSDGALAWRRPINKEMKLLASSGGVFHLSERTTQASGGGRDYRLQGVDGQTGTLLWTTTLPGHNLDFDGGWGIEPDLRRGGSQGPSWRIGRDGAIYGVTLTGAFKLQ